MKIAVTVGGSLMLRNQAARVAGALSARATQHLTADLQQELQAVLHSANARDPDPDLRRDALERAVRRIWGATL